MKITTGMHKSGRTVSLRRNSSDKTIQPPRQGKEPLLLQQAGRRVGRMVGFLRLQQQQVMDTMDPI